MIAERVRVPCAPRQRLPAACLPCSRTHKTTRAMLPLLLHRASTLGCKGGAYKDYVGCTACLTNMGVFGPSVIDVKNWSVTLGDNPPNVSVRRVLALRSSTGCLHCAAAHSAWRRRTTTSCAAA